MEIGVLVSEYKASLRSRRASKREMSHPTFASWQGGVSALQQNLGSKRVGMTLIRAKLMLMTVVLCIFSHGMQSVIAKCRMTNRMSLLFTRRMKEVNTVARD